MRSVKLSDGKSIPTFGWGSGSGKQFNGGQHSIDTGVIALKEGILHIDTAQVRSSLPLPYHRMMKVDDADTLGVPD
jgi:diketogulonate reductase-like aldo/keto reductase